MVRGHVGILNERREGGKLGRLRLMMSLDARGLVARALLLGHPMKAQNVIDSKAAHTAARLPRGVVQKAANRVGLTREDLLSTSRLLLAGIIPDCTRR